jgi:hypothetical protein
MSEYQIFQSGVLGALKTKGFVSAQENDLACDAALMSVSEWAAAKELDLAGAWVEQHYGGAQVSALQDYMTWLETWRGMPQLITISTISMSLNVALANGSSITMSASAIVNDADHLGRAYIELHDRLVSGYETFRQKRQVSAPTNGNGAGTSSAAAGTEIVDVSDIMTEERNGKTYWRLGGGRWQKFGVPCWPEVFKAAGFDQTVYHTGREPFASGYKMEIELENDKPKRVKRLIQKA